VAAMKTVAPTVNRANPINESMAVRNTSLKTTSDPQRNQEKKHLP
jgi:hypothetical protein